MNKGVFSDDFTSVFGDKLTDIFSGGFPSHAGNFPEPTSVMDEPDTGGDSGDKGQVPFDLIIDFFEFDVAGPATQGMTDQSVAGTSSSLLSTDVADVAPMYIGKPDGGGGGGGGGNGGGKPKDDPPPPEPGISETPDTLYLAVGSAAELGADASNFYFSSDGAERVGTEASVADTIEAISGFDIALEFVDDVGSIWSQAIINAANFFTKFIVEGLFVEVDDNGVAKADGLITPPDGSVYWDDLWIKIEVGDYSPGVIAAAGPDQFWPGGASTTGEALPGMGTLTIDVDFLSTMTIKQATLIATHEMMHVLGFGTIWGQSSIFAPWNHDLFNRKGDYTGASANTAYNAEFSSDGGKMPKLAAEDSGGSGTAGGHWETDLAVHANDPLGVLIDDDFSFELMTGWIDTTNSDAVYLSDTSLAVLEDLGYVVDWSVDYVHDSYDFDYGVA